MVSGGVGKVVSDAECPQQCPGNTGENCGDANGGYRLSVFERVCPISYACVLCIVLYGWYSPIVYLLSVKPSRYVCAKRVGKTMEEEEGFISDADASQHPWEKRSMWRITRDSKDNSHPWRLHLQNRHSLCKICPIAVCLVCSWCSRTGRARRKPTF